MYTETSESAPGMEIEPMPALKIDRVSSVEMCDVCGKHPQRYRIIDTDRPDSAGRKLCPFCFVGEMAMIASTDDDSD